MEVPRTSAGTLRVPDRDRTIWYAPSIFKDWTTELPFACCLTRITEQSGDRHVSRFRGLLFPGSSWFCCSSSVPFGASYWTPNFVVVVFDERMNLHLSTFTLV